MDHARAADFILDRMASELISQAEMAKKLEISPAYMTQMLTARTRPICEALLAWAGLTRIRHSYYTYERASNA